MPRKRSLRPTYFFIVTPSFQQAQFIRQTIESVLAQASPTIKIEYWVMDGGSKDKTVSVLKKYGKKIHFQSKPDHGQTDAINKGIKKFQTCVKKLSKIDQQHAIFAYINSDDYYLPDAFKYVAAAFALHQTKQWLVGECWIVDSTSRPIQPLIGFYKRFLRSNYFSQLLFILNVLPQPAVFLRWSAVQKIGLFDDRLRYVMDYQYWLRMQRRFGTPLFLDQPLAAFRIHQLSKGGSQFEKQFAEQYQVAKRFTQNSILLFLQRMHNRITIGVYRLIK